MTIRKLSLSALALAIALGFNLNALAQETVSVDELTLVEEAIADDIASCELGVEDAESCPVCKGEVDAADADMAYHHHHGHHGHHGYGYGYGGHHGYGHNGYGHHGYGHHHHHHHHHHWDQPTDGAEGVNLPEPAVELKN